MEFEFTTIEHSEDPAMNWRRSFAEGLEIKIKDLRMERIAQVKRQIWIDDRCYSVKNLTDAQIERFARRECERDLNRAILERKENEARQRARLGIAC